MGGFDLSTVRLMLFEHAFFERLTGFGSLFGRFRGLPSNSSGSFSGLPSGLSGGFGLGGRHARLGADLKFSFSSSNFLLLFCGLGDFAVVFALDVTALTLALRA